MLPILQSLWNKLTQWFEQAFLVTKGGRFRLLAVALLLGGLLVKYGKESVFCVLGIYSADGNYLIFPMLSLFVFLALWLFRTYDTRQQIHQTHAQIEQTNKQILQANFAKGLDNLVNNDPLQIDIGVILLLEVSKSTPAFDKEIRLAFIKRLQILPEPIYKTFPEKGKFNRWIEIDDSRIPYTPHILRWIVNHPELGWYIEFSRMEFLYNKLQLFHPGKDVKKIPLKEIEDVLNQQASDNNESVL